ncbi:MAG: glutathione S-transferase family protein, partial [Pseudobdellovibrionaceae bacterium]
MVDFYTIKSRDSSKIHILLAELGMKCQVFNLDFTMEDAKKADYLELSPYEGVPAILDLEGENGRQIHVFESG